MKTAMSSLIVILTLAAACNGTKPESKTDEQSPGKFPPKVKLSAYKKTDFIPTIGHRLDRNKNAIYAASLLMAWEKVQELLPGPAIASPSDTDLVLLFGSRAHTKVLKPGEYSSSANVEGDQISARAIFSKSLPFLQPLDSLTGRLLFNKEKVEAFGAMGPSAAASKTIEILYYKSDNDFILKLQPEDTAHEIILCMSSAQHGTFRDMIQAATGRMAAGKKEISVEPYLWKYLICEEDEVLIPEIRFNIEHDYTNMEGKYFSSGTTPWHIDSLYQRTAFTLNRKGAEVESEAEIAVTSAAEPSVSNPPKKMHFNKPFLLMLKRKDNANPYLCIWVANTELMEK